MARAKGMPNAKAGGQPRGAGKEGSAVEATNAMQKAQTLKQDIIAAMQAASTQVSLIEADTKGWKHLHNAENVGELKKDIR